MKNSRILNASTTATAMDRALIPNFDVGPLFGGPPRARRELLRKIGQACHEPGFFYVHNTCVDDHLIGQTLQCAKDFFALPDVSAIKQGVHNERFGGAKGWGPLFEEPAYQENTVAHVESFDFSQPLSDAQSLALGFGPNPWPALPGFAATVQVYYASVTRLGRALAEVFSEMLGLDAGFINAHSGPTAPRTMRLLHYPGNNTPPDDRHVGISAHTDFECFTLMYQTAAGLELTDHLGQWREAPADLGTFTIILGDMTERLSNGRFRATGHRVPNRPWTRYSMILFFALDDGFEVAPLPQFVSPANPARYPPVTQGAHIRAKIAEANANRVEPVP